MLIWHSLTHRSDSNNNNSSSNNCSIDEWKEKTTHSCGSFSLQSLVRSRRGKKCWKVWAKTQKCQGRKEFGHHHHHPWGEVLLCLIHRKCHYRWRGELSWRLDLRWGGKLLTVLSGADRQTDKQKDKQTDSQSD